MRCNVCSHPASKLKAEFQHKAHKSMFNLFRNRASHCLPPAGIVGAMLCALLPLNARPYRRRSEECTASVVWGQLLSAVRRAQPALCFKTLYRSRRGNFDSCRLPGRAKDGAISPRPTGTRHLDSRESAGLISGCRRFGLLPDTPGASRRRASSLRRDSPRPGECWQSRYDGV
jgi:hypothetical protein